MSCRQWSTFTGINAPGQCSFEMIPETENPTQSCSICLTPLVSSRVATLRAFNADNGALLWEKINFGVLGKSPSGTVFGYRWRDDSLGKPYEYIQEWVLPILSSAAVFNSTTELQKKSTFSGDRSGITWVQDCVKVDITGAETVVMRAAKRSFVQGGSAETIPVTSTYFDNGSQIYNCTDDNLCVGYNILKRSFQQVFVEITDKDKRVKKHTIRFFPTLAFAMTTNTPKWVAKCGATVAKFGLYASASEVETELATLEGVVSVTAVGGPLCQGYMDVDIEFDTVDRQISHMCIEWASSDLPSSSTVGANVNPPIVSLETHTYFAPLSLKTLRMTGFHQVSFASSTSGLIGIGNWGPPSVVGQPLSAPKTALSLLQWTTGSGTPNWGTINLKAWQIVPFDGMIQSQEWFETGGAVSLGFGFTAVANGKIAVTAPSRRDAVLSGEVPWQTHLIVDEGSGATISYGWSGFLAGTNIIFGDSDNQYRTGIRHSYTPSGQSASYFNVNYVESYGTDNNAADIRETDIRATYAVGTKQIAFGSGVTEPTATFISSQASNNYAVSGPWMSASSGTIPAGTGYPFGSYRRDFYFILSSAVRFSDSTEWQLLHGSSSGGSFFTYKQTSWFPLYVSLDTVKAELLAWYGSVAGGGNPIVYVNPFGEDPEREATTPQLPTWQRIKEIWVLRDAFSTPNPFSPLAPLSIDRMCLKLRNRRKIVTHSLLGLNPSDGTIAWQRDVGIHPTLNVPANANPMAFAQNTIVVGTLCKAGVDTPIFPRGT